MGSLTNFAELELLDHVYNAAYTPPATIYLALCTADPTDAATGASCNEVANSGSYARVAIAFSAAGTPTDRRVIQNGAVNYAPLTGSIGTASHWCIVDSITYGAGNALAYGAFATPKVLVSGNTPSIATEEIYIEIAAEISIYLSNKLLDLMFRNQAYSKPATYVALATATSDEEDTGATITEPAGGSYARKLVNINGGASPTWNLAANEIVDNTHDIDLGPATGAAWGTIVAVCIVDDADTAEGNMLMYDNTMADQAVGDGDTVRFVAGALDCQLS
jgi:hypothetical protein